ncbi:hypothetical protein [Mycobacterium lepromatosis]|uniref:hypothetical protein n=1 Tax=Mycobacterium lepromatosis TaxID=480418 RepID=UPI0006796B98|nr:hypothetical protein [Mycobacterium lepromatosis]
MLIEKTALIVRRLATPMCARLGISWLSLPAAHGKHPGNAGYIGALGTGWLPSTLTVSGSGI